MQTITVYGSAQLKEVSKLGLPVDMALLQFGEGVGMLQEL